MPSSARQAYLLCYNVLNLSGWLLVLLLTAGLYAPWAATRLGLQAPLLNDFPAWVGQILRGADPFRFLDLWARVVQTAMVLDILHCAAGLTGGWVVTTALQIASRLLLVWAVTPDVSGPTPAHLAMYLAWGAAECIRFLYYISRGKAIRWLRFSAFLVLYPLGVFGGELPLLWVRGQVGDTLGLACRLSMLAYVPGFPVLFAHMLKQRRKTLGGASAA